MNRDRFEEIARMCDEICAIGEQALAAHYARRAAMTLEERAEEGRAAAERAVDEAQEPSS